MLEINQDMYVAYAERLGIAVDLRQATKTQKPYYRRLIAAVASLVRSNIHAFEPCVVASTTSEIDDALFNAGQPSGPPAVRQVIGWTAARMIADGSFRIGTPAEHDRYYAELNAAGALCSQITEASPANVTIRAQREEAANTRELLTMLVGAAVNKQEAPRGPSKPNPKQTAGDTGQGGSN